MTQLQAAATESSAPPEPDERRGPQYYARRFQRCARPG